MLFLQCHVKNDCRLCHFVKEENKADAAADMTRRRRRRPSVPVPTNVKRSGRLGGPSSRPKWIDDVAYYSRVKQRR